jgi:hypothetical protein
MGFEISTLSYCLPPLLNYCPSAIVMKKSSNNMKSVNFDFLVDVPVVPVYLQVLSKVSSCIGG